MQAMTRHTSGATYSVLRLFYVPALVDYSAPVLIALSTTQQERLEVVLQNTALRTTLGAPRWSSTCIMQSETGLVPRTIQVEQMVACRMDRVLQREVEGVSQRRLQLTMTQGAEVLPHNPWLLLRSALTTRHLTHTDNRPSGPQPDLPSPSYRTPPPWESPPAENTATPLPARKALCSTEELRQHALVAMARVTEPERAVYYTDGSVDPDSGRTGAAATAITAGTELLARTPDHCCCCCSTLHTELVAIQLALAHA